MAHFDTLCLHYRRRRKCTSSVQWNTGSSWEFLQMYFWLLQCFSTYHSSYCTSNMLKKKKDLTVFLSKKKKHQKFISDAAVFEFTDMRIVVTVCCIRLHYCSLQISRTIDELCYDVNVILISLSLFCLNISAMSCSLMKECFRRETSGYWNRNNVSPDLTLVWEWACHCNTSFYHWNRSYSIFMWL